MGKKWFVTKFQTSIIVLKWSRPTKEFMTKFWTLELIMVHQKDQIYHGKLLRGVKLGWSPQKTVIPLPDIPICNLILEISCMEDAIIVHLVFYLITHFLIWLTITGWKSIPYLSSLHAKSRNRLSHSAGLRLLFFRWFSSAAARSSGETFSRKGKSSR